MMGPVAIEPSSAIPLPPAPSGTDLLTCSVLRDGSLALIWADHDINAALGQPKSSARLRNPYTLATQSQALVTIFDGATLTEHFRFQMEMPFIAVDRFSGGDWLIAASRWNRGDANARLFDGTGRLLGHLSLGDGIQHLLIDDEDGIWVGWFDEGIFGNDGWRWPGREWPPSSDGLACFGREGSLRWTADQLPQDYERIDDCYALNVIGTAVWACYYSDFPIICVGPTHAPRRWPNAPRAATALAVDRKMALLAGGYGKDRDHFSLVDLSGEVSREVRTGKLALDDGMAFGRLQARGATLHYVSDTLWQRWNVRDFASAAD